MEFIKCEGRQPVPLRKLSSMCIANTTIHPNSIKFCLDGNKKIIWQFESTAKCEQVYANILKKYCDEIQVIPTP